MVERPLLKLPQQFGLPYLPADRFHLSVKALSESELKAFEALVPNEGTHLLKYIRNSIGCGDVTEMPDSAIFTLMSRVNHDCVGNSDHVYEDDRAVMILVANKDINTGEEITFSYRFGSTLERRSCLQKDYNFDCQCTICRGPLELQESFDRIEVLDREILFHAQNARVDKALKCGKSLISLYDQFHQSSFRYYRTYYDLFQCAITTRRTFNDGVFFIKKAHEHSLAFFSDKENEQVKKMKKFADSPKLHRMYLALEF